MSNIKVFVPSGKSNDTNRSNLIIRSNLRIGNTDIKGYTCVNTPSTFSSRYNIKDGDNSKKSSFLSSW